MLTGMNQRAASWYQSGMAETQQYVCLVEAIEDRLKEGIVLYDARVDCKHKADVVILLRNRVIRINSFLGDVESRAGVEHRRDRVERVRKVNTSESAHWGNQERQRSLQLAISRTEDQCLVLNGLRLFSYPAINQLLHQAYEEVGIENGYFFR